MNAKCIIGESDPFIARLLLRFSEESGINSIRAQNGNELSELVELEKPQFIIADVELPGKIRGWQAINTLRQKPEFQHLPVIVCTWLEENETQTLVGQVSGHLQKPELHYRDFVAVLNNAGIEVDKRTTTN